MNPLELTYTPPSTAFRPKDVYENYILDDLIGRIKGYKIVNFRPVNHTDTYLNDAGVVDKGNAYNPGPNRPRFILKRERTDTELLEGVMKIASNPLYKSRKEINLLLDREGL